MFLGCLVWDLELDICIRVGKDTCMTQGEWGFGGDTGVDSEIQKLH